MRLDDALDHVREIHAQVLRSEVYRGYRALPIAVTGGVALTAAVVQDLWLAPADATAYARTWLGVAGGCALLCALDVLRLQRSGALGSWRRRSLPVFLQSLPALAVGGIVTRLLLGRAEAAWLPGIWSLLFGLAVLSARPFLPRAVGFVAAFYLGCGALLLLDQPSGSPASGFAPSPWEMGVPFGVGQTLLALVLYRDLERPRGGQLG